MGKSYQWFVLIILILILSIPCIYQNNGYQIFANRVSEIRFANADNFPFSIPQDSESQSQSAEEDLSDDDDQDKFMHHTSDFNSDSISPSHTKYHLTFRQQHDDVATPPPQS